MKNDSRYTLTVDRPGYRQNEKVLYAADTGTEQLHVYIIQKAITVITIEDNYPPKTAAEYFYNLVPEIPNRGMALTHIAEDRLFPLSQLPNHTVPTVTIVGELETSLRSGK